MVPKSGRPLMLVGKASLVPALLWDNEFVKVWVSPLDLPPSVLQALRQTLSADEKERADSYRLPQMANSFTVRRGLLRVLLSKELGCLPKSLRFALNPLRKPVLASGDGFFSVSSSRDYAAWAFSPVLPVGVDIEWIDPEVPLSALIEDHFSPAEKKRLNAMTGAGEKAEAFFRAWTVKEACAKATGIGLSAPLNRYAVQEFSGTVLDALGGPFITKSRPFPPQPEKAAYWISFALIRKTCAMKV